MAKATLPTNYQDDILNVSTDGKRKYRMVYNDDGTVSFDDVTPYDQEGSDFGAGDINATNEAVNQSLDKAKVIDDLETIQAVTNEGFVMGALAGKALNESLGKCELLYSHSSSTETDYTVDLTKYREVLLTTTNSSGRIFDIKRLSISLFTIGTIIDVIPFGAGAVYSEVINAYCYATRKTVNTIALYSRSNGSYSINLYGVK